MGKNQRNNKKTITELTVTGGAETPKDDGILTELRDFYEKIYSFYMGSDFEKSSHDLTENLSTNLPKLKENWGDALEGMLRLEECRKALWVWELEIPPVKMPLQLNFTNSSLNW